MNCQTKIKIREIEHLQIERKTEQDLIYFRSDISDYVIVRITDSNSFTLICNVISLDMLESSMYKTEIKRH